MNMLRALVAIATVSATLTLQAETASSYEGEITGLVCASCKQEVVDALSKLEGVKNVEITPSNNPEIRKITVASTSNSLTQTDLNQALDKVSKEFKVTKLAKAASQPVK
ncbi:MAG: hypothetical protein JWO94_1824 [Verrucomicrobiaceae bacterium]|nr:hypothetical protein [Verrucomicrobiaceae bacterium]